MDSEGDSTLVKAVESVHSRRYVLKGDKGGEWTHGPELVTDLINGKEKLTDPSLQAELLDWMLTDNMNVFVNKETKEKVFALASKRGNSVYAAKKGEKLDEVLKALKGKELDFPVKGLRADRYRMTKVLFFTLTFSHKRFTREQAWGLIRSSPVGGQKEFGALNGFGANITSIFGPNGKLSCKEADSSGYPAPHVIVILDKPVLVERHNDRDGSVSWRLKDRHILDRLGKDADSRKASIRNVESSILDNPIWDYGMMDVKGVINGFSFGKHTNSMTYLFKYLIKTVSIERFPELSSMRCIEDSDSKSVRTMLYTHMGNKCFRTRDIVFGNAFKTRVGLLSVKKVSGGEWIRVGAMPKFVYDEILAIQLAKVPDATRSARCPPFSLGLISEYDRRRFCPCRRHLHTDGKVRNIDRSRLPTAVCPRCRMRQRHTPVVRPSKAREGIRAADARLDRKNLD